MDPGERAFFTSYSDNGEACKFGHYDMRNKILPLLKKIDYLCSVLKKNVEIKKKTKNKIRRRIRYLRYKIFNLKKEIHHKASLFLCRNYRIIFLPKFNGKQMSELHMLSHEVNRRMLCWGHYNFREILLNKAEKYPDCRVHIVSEEYTSKTCSNCGSIKKIGGSETYNCNKCNVVQDRDLNGARNIFLKSLL